MSWYTTSVDYVRDKINDHPYAAASVFGLLLAGSSIYQRMENSIPKKEELVILFENKPKPKVPQVPKPTIDDKIKPTIPNRHEDGSFYPTR